MSKDSLPSVAVVIPAHNAEKWIRRALASTLAQSKAPAEIVVIDDHSVDATARVAAEFSPLVRVEVASRAGSNPARNQGLRLVKSEWVQFLDADDYLLPDKLERQLSLATQQATPVDLIYSPNFLVFDSDPDLSQTSRRQESAGSDDPLLAYILNRGFQTGAVLWRRLSLVGIGGWDEETPRCQDYELASRALRAGLAARWSPYAGAAYCLHDSPSLSRAQPMATTQRTVDQLAAFCTWLRTQGRYRAPYATAAHRRMLALLWAAESDAPVWARETYARLRSDGLLRRAWFGSRLEFCLELLGWNTTARLRRRLGTRRRK